MANILAILPGISLAALDAMTIAELLAWQDRAIARLPARRNSRN